MKKIYFIILLLVTSSCLQAQVLQWAKQFTGPDDVFSNAVARDASGNVYTTGSFRGTVDFDPGPATFNLISPGPDFMFVSKLDAAGNFVWAKQIGEAGTPCRGNSIALDASGNVYTTGAFGGGAGGTVDFDPGPAIFNLTSAGQDDIFVSKLDAAGNFVWAKQLGGTDTDAGRSIALDASGNVYTTGSFSGTADFDPGAATFNLTAAGGFDIFVSKLDAAGNFVWAKQLGGTDIDNGLSIALDASGNVYTTGNFLGTADFDPGAATFNLTSAGGHDVFISKLNAAGNFVWAKRLGGTDNDDGNSIALDASGNLYTTGSFQGTADFDPGAATFNLTSAGSNDIFVNKLDAAGNFVWAKQLGGTDNDAGFSIALDASGNIYTTGGFGGDTGGTVDFDPGAATFNLTSAGKEDVFVSKLDAAGNFVWAIQLGGTDYDEGVSIALDASGNVYTTGSFRGTADFDPCSGTFNLTAPITFSGNPFVHKMSQAVTVPIVTPDATVCSGNNSGTVTLSGHSGSVFRWESSVDNFVTITTIANTTATQTYTNLTQTTKYRAVVQNGSCTAPISTAATITVTTGSCLQAQTWTGATNTNWNTATNWTPATVPTITSDVVISGSLVNYPVFSNNVTINTIDMQGGSGLDVNGFTLSIANAGVNFNSFTGATLNNSNGATDIVINLNSGGGYPTTVRNNTFNDAVIFNINGIAAFNEADTAGQGNHYTGNATFNFGSSGPLNISYLDKSQFDGNLTINNTGTGSTRAFNAGGAVTGNFTFTTNTGSGGIVGTVFGNPGIKTTIGGAINITANYTTPDYFKMYRLINQTGGGSINVQNSGAGFTLEKDTLIVNPLSITGYKTGGQSFFSDNSITGNVTTASDAGNTYTTFFRNNTIAGNSSFTSNGPGSLNDADIASSGNKYIGNVTYTSTSGNISVGAGSFTEITQNLTLNSASGITLGKIKFNSSANSIIEQLGIQPITISEPTIEKTGAGKITLNDPVTVSVSGILNFNGGNIFSSTGNELVFSDDATYTGLSIASHADGPVTKIGNDIFTFPIGKATVLTPISISAPAIVTDAFRAQYFSQPPNSAGYNITLKDVTLNHLSSTEYYLLDRTAGTSNVFVTLSWETSRSGTVNNMPDLRVARWNGSLWKDEGNGGTTGANAAGTVKSLRAVSNFSPFTLASSSPLNPLPVTLLSFTASKCSSNVCLLWSTENEQNFSHFEIEKSSDGSTFTLFGNVATRNTAGRNTYASTDINPASGNNFYRLKMVDIDGKIKYSNIVRVNFDKPEQVSILPNPAADIVIIKGVSGYKQLRIIDVSGRVKYQQAIKKSIEEINISQLPAGIYIVQLQNDNGTTALKLIKQ